MAEEAFLNGGGGDFAAIFVVVTPSMGTPVIGTDF